MSFAVDSLLKNNSTQILFQMYIFLGIISVFMIINLLLYYIKRSIGNYELLIKLGMSKKVYAFVRAMESIVGIFMISFIGLCFGTIVSTLTVFVLNKSGMLVTALQSGIDVYIKSLVVIFFIFVFSCMATRDIWRERKSGNFVNKEDVQEKIPTRFLKSLFGIGIVLCIGQVYRYTKIYNFESIILVVLFLGGLFLIFRCGIVLLYMGKRKKISYFDRLLENSQMWNKTLTNTGYLFGLFLIQFFVMLFFSLQIVSTFLAERPTQLYPYDIVCIANEEDKDFFQQIKEQYKLEIKSYPMVRISNYDMTESIESRGQRTIQGQQIGISESTYHELKKNIDTNYKKIALNLDHKGEKIYVVHQQDKATKAQPVDFWMHSSKPLLHIGAPCPGVTSEMALTSRKSDVGYYYKTIQGEEIGSLIGVFGQGVQENMIVFSDEYFLEAEKWWESRNIRTGREITDPKDRILNVTVRQGPTNLVLINNVKKEDTPKIKKDMGIFKKRHVDDEAYNPSIRSYYLKEEAISQLAMERVIKITMSILLIFYFFVVSIFVISMKLITNCKENIKRNQFLKCMGVEIKKRRRLIHRENYKFFYVPAAVAWVSALLFVAAAFLARMYSLQMKMECLKYLLFIWMSYTILLGVIMKVLLLFYVRFLEEK